jgi:Flp pilus assembly CpaE family ATPase
VSSADVSPKFGTKHADAIGAETLSVALIGPNEEKRSAVAKSLAETRRANVREFTSYPPGHDHLQKLLAAFDVIIIDLDSDPDVARQLVERASAVATATIMVYSENADPKLAFRMMHAGAREYLVLPLEQGAVAEALAQTGPIARDRALPEEKAPGKLLVFVGAKGGSGVTTVASNVAIALAQESEQRVLLVDLALPIGDAALCLGIAADYSTEDALRNIDRLDADFLQSLLVQHRSGVFVLAAPTKVPEVEVSKAAISKLIATARSGFDHVIVDVGSRVDVAAKVLFEDATTTYLVTQTGISELRNSNRLISQLFTEGSSNLEIVINRVEPRFLEAANDETITKALGRPVSWKIPDDQNAGRALQHSGAGLAEARISRISLEMASSITGRALPKEKKRDFDLKGLGRSVAQAGSGNDELPGMTNLASADAGAPPSITWPALDPITYGIKLTTAQLNATASVAGTFVYTPGQGYVLPVGTHTLWATFTPEEYDGEDPLQAANSIVVDKATPVLSWPTPANLICGAALDENQLNASAAVPGRFDYSPALGEVLAPGTHTISVTFTPADNAKYNPSQASVSVTVARETPAIQWPMPDPIAYGTQLTETQLCAAAPVPGTFEYDPGLGAVLSAGEHNLSVVFTPEDNLAYSTSQTAVLLTVAKATPSITWTAPDQMPYGKQLSAAQLCARASVAGTFKYSPDLGAMLAAGEHHLSVLFTPADHFDYSPSQAAVELSVAKVVPSITWRVPDPISYGGAISATQLNATANVPGSFAYTPAAGEILMPGSHELSVAFTPADALNYTTEQAVVSLAVKEKSPTFITWPAPSVISYGTELSANELNATASAPGRFVYTPSAGHILAPGRYTLSATFRPSDAEKFAHAQASVVLEVERSSDIALPSTAAAETPYTWTFNAINSSPKDSAPAQVTRERASAAVNPPETRMYKGVVYEKGEDGQWHIQKQ